MLALKSVKNRYAQKQFYVIHVDSDIGTVTMDGESVYRGGYRGGLADPGGTSGKSPLPQDWKSAKISKFSAIKRNLSSIYAGKFV